MEVSGLWKEGEGWKAGLQRSRRVTSSVEPREIALLRFLWKPHSQLPLGLARAEWSQSESLLHEPGPEKGRERGCGSRGRRRQDSMKSPCF